MRHIPTMLCALACVALLSPPQARAAEPAQVLKLWPGTPPGDQDFKGTEADTTKESDRPVGGRRVIRLGNVSSPTLALYPAPGGGANRPAVLVCPGGAYRILAMDLEGTEVCEWLNSIGVTGLLLKYRVPNRPGLARHEAALQDAERAMGLARFHAKEWGIDSAHIGVIGFSAGGHLAAVLSNSHGPRDYPAIDDADKLGCQPDFALLVYPAYLTIKEKGDALTPELHVSSNTPPTFIAMAEDDPVRVETALYYSLALRQASATFELHVYPTGGHGYGLRPDKDLVTTWPQRAADFLRSRGIIAGH